MIMGIISIALMLLCCILLIKNYVTYNQHTKISNAIFAYNMYLIINGDYCIGNNSVNYDDMESYESTLFRLWDWGCTRILPKEKFEIIKPYLKKG